MIKLIFGDVRNKTILTPNHFVSHMIEHIAWRMGLSIQLEWPGEDWRRLGEALGAEISKLPCRAGEAAALGMIDDGSASVAVIRGQGGFELTAAGGVDLQWFIDSRCEQLESGKSLVELGRGLSDRLGARIAVQIWSVEDPHHTWEAVYRGIGMALARIFAPDGGNAEVQSDSNQPAAERFSKRGEVIVLDKGTERAKVFRETAETQVKASIDLSAPDECAFQIEVDQSIRDAVRDAGKLLEIFFKALGAGFTIDFKASSLSSSHVVMEDIGLTAGRALLEILKSRMEEYGVNGAGSNLSSAADITAQNVRVGVSVEGRKFWRLIPEDGNFGKLRKDFVIGHEVLRGLRSEDLDDFLDGFAGGLSASIVVHIRNYANANDGWLSIFENLGTALSHALIINRSRRWVGPGVKATLT